MVLRRKYNFRLTMFLYLISRLPLHLYPHVRRQYGLQTPGNTQRAVTHEVQQLNPQEGEGGGGGGFRLRLQPSVLVTHSTTRSIANTKLRFFMFLN